MLKEVTGLYDRYVQQVEDLEKNRKFGEGLFGTKDGPKNHPCHGKFAEDLDRLLEEQENTAPESSAVKDVLAFIYTAPRRYSPPMSAYWMLIAVQGLTARLTERLDPKDAEELLAQYGKEYRRRERLPVQDQIVRQLKARSAGV